MRPALGEFQTCSGHQVSDNSRNENFVGLRLRHDARCGVNGYSSNIPPSDFNFAGMETRT
jgi:hypothetical protein